jgi:hypothetical protein
MSTFSSQFADALSNIEPSDDDKENAPSAHEQVRDALNGDEQLREWGLSAILIGSYKRQVSIRRVKDVDVFGRLEDLPDDVEPGDLLDRFFDVLSDAFPPGDDGEPRVKKNARSVQVLFPEFDDLYVDAVPARPCGDHWEVPQHEPTEGWEETNPTKLGELTTAMNKDWEERYVPTVKLMRQTRRALRGKARPGGLYVELATYTAFKSGDVSGETQGELYVSTLRAVATLLDAAADGDELDDPTLDGKKVAIRATDDQRRKLADAFLDAADRAESAINSNRECWAAKQFRDLLGKNGDGEFVFPMPAGCNNDGTVKSFTSLAAGEARVPAGDKTFG